MSRTIGRSESAYHALARKLRKAILENRFADGRLPTEAELATEHGLSRQTVRRAFHDLVSEGLVYRVPGRGTFPTSRDGHYLRHFGSVEDLMALSLDTTFELVTPLHHEDDTATATRLGLDSDAVMSVAFRRIHHGGVFCLTIVQMPPSVGCLLRTAPELSTPGATSPVTVLGLIDKHCDKPIAEAEQSITAVAAHAGIAEHLGVTVGDPLLRIDRLYFDVDDRAVELATSYFLPEQYTYRVRLRRSVR